MYSNISIHEYAKADNSFSFNEESGIINFNLCGKDKVEFSRTDFYEIQSYIEVYHPEVNYYINKAGYNLDKYFTIIIQERWPVLNTLSIFKNTDDYFFIKQRFTIRPTKEIEIFDSSFPGTTNYILADQIEGLLLFIKDIIDLYRNNIESDKLKSVLTSHVSNIIPMGSVISNFSSLYKLNVIYRSGSLYQYTFPFNSHDLKRLDYWL